MIVRYIIIAPYFSEKCLTYWWSLLPTKFFTKMHYAKCQRRYLCTKCLVHARLTLPTKAAKLIRLKFWAVFVCAPTFVPCRSLLSAYMVRPVTVCPMRRQHPCMHILEAHLFRCSSKMEMTRCSLSLTCELVEGIPCWEETVKNVASNFAQWYVHILRWSLELELPR
jgi:hypothetical protein